MHQRWFVLGGVLPLFFPTLLALSLLKLHTKANGSKEEGARGDRLTRAKESTLDYMLGINRPSAPRQPNSVSLKDWGT